MLQSLSRHIFGHTMKIELVLKLVVLLGSFTTRVKAQSSISDFVVDSDCYFELSDSSGDLYSPNFPLHYPENKICKWTISAPKYDHIELQFTSAFSVERGTVQGGVCDRDFVEVFGGSTNRGNRYCNSRGRMPDEKITSSTNVLHVLLKSGNWTKLERGFFHAKYRRKPCGGVLTGPGETFGSPNFPRPYPAKKECIWQIQVPTEKVIELYISNFKLNEDSDCHFDFVNVRDGYNSTSKQLGHFCNGQSPYQAYAIRSTGNSMYIQFKSFKGATLQRFGFHAYYKTVDHCHGSLRGKSVSFTSPGFPKSAVLKNAIKKECDWLIEASPGKSVMLTFQTFDISNTGKDVAQSGDVCADNYIKVYDSNNDLELATSLGTYCNAKPVPNQILSTTNTMFVKFRRTVANAGKGFYATYFEIDPYNHYEGCSEKSHNLLFKCKNGRYIQCQWKCDSADDCGDNSDEVNCLKAVYEQGTKKQHDSIQSYIIIILSITGSAMAIVCVAFIVDRLRRKQRTRTRSRNRRGHRRRRPRITMPDEAPLTDYPSTPPPPYETAVTSVCSMGPFPYEEVAALAGRSMLIASRSTTVERGIATNDVPSAESIPASVLEYSAAEQSVSTVQQSQVRGDTLTAVLPEQQNTREQRLCASYGDVEEMAVTENVSSLEEVDNVVIISESPPASDATPLIS